MKLELQILLMIKEDQTASSSGGYPRQINVVLNWF